jgi:prefoldin alpha subunit
MKTLKNPNLFGLNMDQNLEQELGRKFQVFEQQIRMLQEQLQSVEQTSLDLQNLDLGLDDLKSSKDKEILAQVGRGIFVKAKVLSEDLIVDIGGKNFVTKSIENTKEIINSQVEKLSEIKEDLENELEKINSEITNVFMEHQEKMASEGSENKDFGIKLKSEKECDCDEDCAEKGEDCHCHDGECHCGHHHH